MKVRVARVVHGFAFLAIADFSRPHRIARIVTQARGDIPEGEGEDNVKDSLAFIQLAKHNERLKEALIRLRDLSNENEQDNKRRIADLEKELDLTSDLQGAFLFL
jgi:dynactin 1